MIIKKIKLKNIRSYNEKEISFSTGSTLLSGDIGSGKSTVLLAIDFALFGLSKGIITGEALLRHGQKEGSVELNFLIDNNDITIRRNLKKSGSSIAQDSGYIIINGEQENLSPIELKQRVLEILNYPQETLTKKSLIYRYTVYTPQEEMKSILLGDWESRLDTLRRIFNIDKYKRIQENSRILSSDLRLKIKEKELMIFGLEELKKTIPKHLTELMEVPGLGAKRAKKLYERLHIKSIKELEKAAKQHKISRLETFKEKSEENILKGIELIKRGKGRTLLGIALPMARNIIAELKTLKKIKRINVAGSLRRMEETIGDIDLLVISSDPKKVMDRFTNLKDVDRILARGETKSTVILKNSMQCDVRVLDEKNYGAALQYFTGNKGHNIRLRELAIKKGYKLNEYGLFKKDKYICGRTEGEIYKNLGIIRMNLN